MQNELLTVTILYDNRGGGAGLTTGWGFSALVELGGTTVLFDTGADNLILSRNMEELDVDPQAIEAVVLSHPHCDHTGGLSAVLKENSDLTVYAPEDFPSSVKRSVNAYGANYQPVSSPIELEEGKGAISSTGPVKTNHKGQEMSEEGLVVESQRGPVLITGCAHPGIVKMVEAAEKLVEDRIHLVVGGFHMGEMKEAQIKDIVEELKEKVEWVCPCHCTGEKGIEGFKQGFDNKFIPGEVGKVL